MSRPDGARAAHAGENVDAADTVDAVDVDVLVVGAGVTGLGFVSFLREARTDVSVVVVDAGAAPGGYCQTVRNSGFVWDYSGHFFHFRHPEIEARLVDRIGRDRVRTVQKRARVVDAFGVEVSFPYQRALFELPAPVQERALVELWQRAQTRPAAASSFKAMLRAQAGPTVSTRFLEPYNEKLYACDLDTLDPHAMGRFFPHTHFDDVMAAAARRVAAADGAGANANANVDDGTYNARFTYPHDGAVAYVNALLPDVPPGALRLRRRLVEVDRAARVAVVVGVDGAVERYRYRRLVSSAPLPQLLQACGVDVDAAVFRHNRVLVFNLGFDAKGRADAHWVYFAAPELPFYRVGFYDNILGTKRMSLYVEVGLSAAGDVDVEALRLAVLQGLKQAGIVTTQNLVAEHHIVMDPAYVHLTTAGLAATAQWRAALAADGVHSVGRYGAWTYCSIEDNLVEARATAGLVVAALADPTRAAGGAP
jgi:protoporphyrinogen oxidase